MDIIAHCRAAVKEPGSAFFIKKRAVFCQAPPHSDEQALCQSDTIAAPALCGQHPCPLRRFAPAPPKGEPLACRATFRWMPKARQGAKERASLTGAAASEQERLVKLL
ncbi:MAG: hypothetical protein BHW28_00980 [Faecalibacterium prausnitzii]|nr:MAG: hypothetical protein BHW28_00980 [Faecalibacterium prausnitzii]